MDAHLSRNTPTRERRSRLRHADSSAVETPTDSLRSAGRSTRHTDALSEPLPMDEVGTAGLHPAGSLSTLGGSSADPGQGSPNVELEDEPQEEAEETGLATNSDDAVTLLWDWKALWGSVMLSGTRKVTRDQYESIRGLAHRISDALTDDSRATRLPAFSSIHRTYRPRIYERLAVRSFLFRAPVQLRAAGLRPAQVNSDGTLRVPLKYTLPSEYARADLASPSVHSAMYASSLSGFRERSGIAELVPKPSDLCVDSLPVVRDRAWFYDANHGFSVDSCDWPVPCEFAQIGEHVLIEPLGSSDLRSDMCSAFAIPREHNTASIRLLGVVQFIWTVRFGENEALPNADMARMNSLCPRDVAVVRNLYLSSYQSPGDIAGTPTQRAKSWASWCSPPLKPADIVALLAPTNSLDEKSRLCVIFRFWTEKSEPDRHFLFIPADVESMAKTFAPPAPALQPLRRPLSPTLDLQVRPGCPMAHPLYPLLAVSATCPLERSTLCTASFYTGTAFGFLSGKQGSGEGIYLLPLNLSLRQRSSPNAVRVLCFAPPGVKPDTVLPLIFDDILTGCTTGFVDFDSTGQKRRIFLDLVGFIADTPAANACLDVLGHNAKACCHQCRYYRSSSRRVGTSVTKTDSDGWKTATRRTQCRHDAIRAAGAGEDTCKRLGITRSPSHAKTVLAQFADKLRQLETPVIRTMSGSQLLSRCVDVYRSNVVAPDHAVTGHFHDLLSLCFRLIPTTDLRRKVEAFLLQYLADAGLPEQSRLIEHGKVQVLRMSMTHTFAVALVAPFALQASHSYLESHHSFRAANSFTLALKALFSFQKIICMLYAVPDVDKDTHSSLAEFDADGGLRRIYEMRALFDEHLSIIRDCGTMPDADVHAMEQARRGSNRRRDLTAIFNACSASVACLDKPNVHRLRELFASTLHMLWAPALVGELILEKRHQFLKRAIALSNHKELHIHAMNTALFNDWQGRLRVCLAKASDGDDDALRSAFRLLSGRDALDSSSGSLPTNLRTGFVSALQQTCIVRKELERQNLSVLATNIGMTTATLRVPQKTSEITTPSRLATLLSIFTARLRTNYSSLSIVTSVMLSTHPTRPRVHISSNTLLRVFFSARDTSWPDSCFVPVVGQGPHSSDVTAAVFCTRDIVRVCLADGSTLFFSNVFPVRPASIADPSGPQVLDKEHELLLPLSSDALVCAWLHDCAAYACHPTEQNNAVRHEPETDPLCGGRFYILSRENGFPPRAG